jgi:hypothetical protein
MDAGLCAVEREQFQPIVEWVDVGYKARTASTVIELPRVAAVGSRQTEAMRELVRTLPPKPVLPPAKAVLKAAPAESKPQLPRWLSRISQRLVE